MRTVGIDNLSPRMILAEDIFLEGSYTPLMRKDTVMDDLSIERLKRRGIRVVKIVGKDEDPPSQKNVPNRQDYYVPKAKPIISKQLQKQALGELENIFSGVSAVKGDIHGSSANIIKQVDNVVEQLVDSIEESRGALVNINDLKSYDEYTYHHSLSVAVLSIAIGQQMGLSSKDLHRLGVCAMMHDIGKTSVPIEVLNKNGKLTDDEFVVIKTHSSIGWEYLSHTDVDDEEILLGVQHHHEKVDGTGYPMGLKGDEIPLWSRIISVADVYDALTSNRPYRTPAQPNEAIEYIMGGIDTSFDYEVVYAFVYKVELYPVGGMIELSNQRTAIVLDNYSALRPIVRMTDTGDVFDLFHDRDCRNLVVTRLVEEPENFGDEKV